MGLFRDRLGEASEIASYERRVRRMKPHTPPTKKAPAPHSCGRMCQTRGRTKAVCGATVRGGVCPCPDY